MKSDAPDAAVVIVGGGYSGTMAAVELARRGIASTVVEGGGRAGRGVAYSTRQPAHLLNVRAMRMSAFADRPDDFASAVADEGWTATDYVPRARFGRYLRDILDEALASDAVTLIEQGAVSAQRLGAGWQVTLADGRTLGATAAVLAHGNLPPEPMRIATAVSPARFVNNPWLPAAEEVVARLSGEQGDALILGTGLTMVDLVLSLDEAGHRGRILALSRRGLVPRAHEAFAPVAVRSEDIPHGDALALSRWLRRRTAAVGWRPAIDALRPCSQALWHSFDIRQRRRFLRHARPYWDVHRHRIAPAVANRLQRMTSEGRLEIVGGRVQSMREEAEAIAVLFTRRGQNEGVERRFGAAFNCTGPLGAISRTIDPLLRQLIDEGVIGIDALGIGIQVDESSRAGERLWALGPLTKGVFWEVVAVPDIRGQVARVADDIARELRR